MTETIVVLAFVALLGLVWWGISKLPDDPNVGGGGGDVG